MRLELYHKENCPFSAKVRTFISSHDLKNQVDYHDIDQDRTTRQDLFRLSHDEQVPCLVVNGKPMLESEEIIAWLSSHEQEIKQTH
ncbi:MAG: glutaredoxin [Proteobacteria bacterium]|nr:MAG: glutaredoxin [Pseudomonadota bacterium]